MLKAVSLSFLLLLFNSLAFSQIFPKEGSQLNYRIIGFSFPANNNTASYKLEIATGNYNNEDSFKNNIAVTKEINDTKVICEVPSFGTNYTWRVKYGDADSGSKLSHFSTGYITNIDSSLFRLTIDNGAEKYTDGLVFLDGTKALYDMKGQPVWYLPDIVPEIKDNTQIRDLKITPAGTITFILCDALIPQIYEINYNADMLWKGPNDGSVARDNIEHYHDEFTRLSNGHYMVMGTEFVRTSFPLANNDRTESGLPDNLNQNTSLELNVAFGTIIEYDNQGKVVWSWRSSQNFAGSDIINYRNPITKMPEPDIHDNSFFFDEKQQAIYISYTRISRIIKLKYPDGVIAGIFGEIYKPGVPARGNGLFCQQHSCIIAQDGGILVFNNNDCKSHALPSLIKMKESGSAKYGLEKVWEMECPTSDLISTAKVGINKTLPSLGGNLIALPGQSYFVSECGPYGNLFIADRYKSILWSALPEKWNANKNKWEAFPQNRASIVLNSKDLEGLIWHSENK